MQRQDDAPQNPGEDLRTLRLARDLSQRELADLTGTSIKTVQRAEAGGVPGSATRARLAQALGITPAQLWAQDSEEAVHPGQRLRGLREASRQSVEEVAQAAGLSAEHLRRIERGEVDRPGDRTLASLGQAMSADMATLWPDFRDPYESAAEILEAHAEGHDWKYRLDDRDGEFVLEMRLGTAECPPDAPFVGCAAYGRWGPLERELRRERWDPKQVKQVQSVCRALRAASDGLLLAVLNLPGAPRALGLAQPNTSAFYGREHSAAGTFSRRVWRDYYHDAAYVLIDEVDRRIGAAHIQLAHLTSHGWPRDLAPSTLEGIGHLVDERGAELQVDVIHVDPCCLPDPGPLEEAVGVLNEEQAAADAPRFRPIPTKEIDPSSIGLPRIEGLSLIKVELISGLGANAAASRSDRVATDLALRKEPS